MRRDGTIAPATLGIAALALAAALSSPRPATARPPEELRAYLLSAPGAGVPCAVRRDSVAGRGVQRTFSLHPNPWSDIIEVELEDADGRAPADRLAFDLNGAERDAEPFLGRTPLADLPGLSDLGAPAVAQEIASVLLHPRAPVLTVEVAWQVGDVFARLRHRTLVRPETPGQAERAALALAVARRQDEKLAVGLGLRPPPKGSPDAGQGPDECR